MAFAGMLDIPNLGISSKTAASCVTPKILGKLPVFALLQEGI